MKNLLAQSSTVKFSDIVKGTGPDGLDPSFTSIGGIITKAFLFILVFAGIGLLLMLIAGGYDFLTSGGDPKKLDQGKQRLTNAIVGFLIVFTAFWLTQIIGKMLGLDAITNVFQ